MGRIDRSVVSYAFLAQAHRSGGDLLTGLMPIFKPIAKMREGEKFDPADFSNTVKDIYGLDVSSWAVESLTPRLESAGVLAKVMLAEEAHDYVYAPIEDEYSEVSERDVSYVLDRFVEFAKPLVEGREEACISDDDLKESFLSHIVNVDFFGALLKPHRKVESSGSGIRKRLGLKKSEEQVAWENEKITRSRIDVLCAAFVLDLYNNDKELYALVARITAGALISEVVLNFQNPDTGVSLHGLRIFLDSPFLMDVLDLGAGDAHLASKNICETLIEHGARLSVFSHSVDEMKENLSAVVSSVDTGKGFGATARRLANSSFRAYVSEVKNSPESRLRQAGIDVLDVPKVDKYYLHFSEEDEQGVFKSLGYYANTIAQRRDAESVSAIMRLRSGKRVKMGKVQSCQHLFITSNAWVADKAKGFLIRNKIYEESDVPPVLTDRNVAGLLWVMYGGKAGDLPGQTLLANCAAAVEPTNDLIDRMHGFLKELDDEKAEYFRALMTEERAGQYLSQLSLGDSSYVSPDNVSAMLDSMKLSLLENHEREKSEEIEALKSDFIEKEKRMAGLHEKKQKEIEEELLKTRTEVLKSKSEIKRLEDVSVSLEKEVASANSREAERLKVAIEWSVRKARRAKKMAHFFLAFCMAAAGVASAFFANYYAVSYLQYFGYIIGSLLIFFSFWKIPDYLFGSALEKLKLTVFYSNLGSRGVGKKDLDGFSVDWGSGKILRRDAFDR